MKARFDLFAFLFLAAILVAGILVSCSANGNLIYYTLQNEVKTQDSSMPNDVTLFDIVKYPATAGNYYAAAGAIWKSPASMNWDISNPIAPPQSGAMCNALVEFNGSLCGGFFIPGDYTTTSNTLGLYQSTVDPATFAGQAVKLAKQVTTLAAVTVNGTPHLLIAAAEQKAPGENYHYCLYDTTDLITFVPLIQNGTAPGPAATPITGLAHTSLGGDKYWATSGTTLFMWDVTMSTLTTASIPFSGEDLRSIYSDDGAQNLFISTAQGHVYYSPDASGTWTGSDQQKVSSGQTVKLNGIARSSGSTLLVGSDLYGYFTLTLSGNTPVLNRASPSTISLYGAVVRKLFIDDTVTPKRVFACTSGNGLWRGEPFDPATGSIGTWYQE